MKLKYQTSNELINFENEANNLENEETNNFENSEEIFTECHPGYRVRVHPVHMTLL